MPIIEIQALPPAEPVDVPAALAAVTKVVASHLEEDPRGTWALWRPLTPGAYAEGTEAPASQPDATHPALVDLFAAEREDLPRLLHVVGSAVADAFDLAPGNVVVRFRPARSDRVSWGE
jgi:phenylpyruvate tautomerase PptA (4-oxalocrotonate tautomerase family)